MRTPPLHDMHASYPTAGYFPVDPKGEAVPGTRRAIHELRQRIVQETHRRVMELRDRIVTETRGQIHRG